MLIDKSINYFINQNTLKKKLYNFYERSLSIGDIISIIYWRHGYVHKFEGVCISIKKKSININSSIILRNVILGVGIELTISFFFHRVYNLTISNYKRKASFYKRSKLFFLRSKSNRSSRVK